ncbi:MAG: tetratricopeptide repeat protein [Bdellovibrio sp.]|nr:tetratricopeptide repeat protein [Bdellovibrio sp.]
MKNKISLITVTLGLFVGSFVLAQKTDTSSQDLLIKKLTQIQLNLAPSDASRNSVVLRLADLHSERARLLSMKEINDGCTVCKAGDADRIKSLSYYNEALAKAPDSVKAKVYLQLGHLYELNGQKDKAEKNYAQILSISSNPMELAEAHLSLAESAFRKNDFKTAISHYEKVLATEGASSQGLAAYRKSWCLFKMGQPEQAIEQLKVILKDPKLQSRMAISRGVADNQFLEEVSRDLVTFMGARGIKAGDAETIYSLTPESFRLQQVTLLAREGLRLGQKEMDLKVWEFVAEKHNDPKIRLEAKVRQAQLLFDLKKTDAAQNQYAGALGLWTAAGCTVESCDEIYKGLRQFVIGWNRIEIKKPSAELVSAYQDYLKVFPQDVDMQIWTAQAMALNGQYKAAAELNMQTNALLVAQTDKEKLEKNLLLAIENAEKAKDEKLLMAAQDDYLAKSITKQKAQDVEYQRAYAIYQKEDYVKASEAMRAIALGNGKDAKIKLQAAELAMDAAVLMKDDVKLQAWSAEFAARFPEKKTDFTSIYQKTVLNQSAALAKTDSAQALIVLNQFNVAAAKPEDKKVYLKNKILLNEKLNKISEARVAVEDYLKLPGLTGAETEFALERKVWFAELELDFTTALKTLEMTKNTSVSNDQKVLKLALFSELAEKNPQSYYTQYLKQSKDAEKKSLIALRLVKVSKTPEKELAVMRPYLEGQPELLAQAVMSAYASTKNRKLLETLVKNKNASKTAAFALASRILFLENLRSVTKTVAAHQINPKTIKTLSATLKARVKLLEQLDTLANQAIASADWSSQLLSLDLVAKENKRFYTEVLSLPTPEGLTGEDEQQYLGLLSQQVAPNQSKSEMAEIKVKEFWADKSVNEKYKSALAANPEWSSYVAEEVAMVSAVAPEAQKAGFSEIQAMASIRKVAANQPTFAELEKARLNLKQNPFVASAVKNVLELEKKADRTAMVEYLESRLSGLPAAGTEQKKEIN